MTITLPQLIPLLPLLIIGLTTVIMMISIGFYRNHCLHAIISIISLNAAFVSLFFVAQAVGKDITPLMRIDEYSVFYTGLILLASLGICTFAYSWLKVLDDNKEEFYLLILISTLGGILLANANHLTSLFLGTELISLPLFGLVGYTFRQNPSLEASIKYTILSSTASSFLLFGIALLYAKTGNLSFTALIKNLNNGALHEPLLQVALGMMIVGLGFKLSLIPFHLWTPDVYQGAPAPVSGFLATVSKIAIFGVLMRLFLSISVEERDVVCIVLGIIAFLSIIFGNLKALCQTNIKRLLAYSSISHLGYLLIALIAQPISKMSIETVGIYWIGYLFSNLGAFGILSLVSSPYRNLDVDSLFSYRGLFWYHPILSLVMTIMMLSLAGIPITLGFIGKFYVLAVCIQARLWWLTVGVIIGSSIGLYYYLRVAINLYLSAPQNINYSELHNWQFSAGGIIVLISGLLVPILGIYPQPLINIMQYMMPSI